MLSDETLRSALKFRLDRDWQQFHTPLNLAVAISVEAGELLEHFQWSTPDERRPTDAQREGVIHEIADIAILVTYLANDLGIDIDTAVQSKLALNAQRFPIDKARGSARKYDNL